MTQNNGYMTDLINQPQALRDTLRGLREQSVPERLTLRSTQSPYRRVVLTGMGSSWHAFHPLQQALVRRGVDAFLVETSELLYSLPGLLQPDTLVIAASQSGRSAEIISLLERRGAGFALLGVSNTHGSPLAEQSDACVLTRAGEEQTVSCKTYIATLAALAWLEPVLFGEDPGEVLQALDGAVPAVAEYLERLDAHVTDLQGRMARTRDLFLVGRGTSLAAALAGGLINKEAAHVHSEGMSSAGLRHGPYEMLSLEAFVLVYEGEGPTAALNRRLYEDVLQTGAPAGLVSESAPEPVFRLAPVDPRARPILEILPAEMMTLALSGLKGHEAGKFTRNTKVTTVE